MRRSPGLYLQEADHSNKPWNDCFSRVFAGTNLISPPGLGTSCLLERRLQHFPFHQHFIALIESSVLVFKSVAGNLARRGHEIIGVGPSALTRALTHYRGQSTNLPILRLPRHLGLNHHYTTHYTLNRRPSSSRSLCP